MLEFCKYNEEKEYHISSHEVYKGFFLQYCQLNLIDMDLSKEDSVEEEYHSYKTFEVSTTIQHTLRLICNNRELVRRK